MKTKEMDFSQNGWSEVTKPTAFTMSILFLGIQVQLTLDYEVNRGSGDVGSSSDFFSEGKTINKLIALGHSHLIYNIGTIT